MGNYESSAKITSYSMLAGLILLIILMLTSCTPTSKMVMPDGCKPAKKAKYEMVKPEPTIERKKNE